MHFLSLVIAMNRSENTGLGSTGETPRMKQLSFCGIVGIHTLTYIKDDQTFVH